MKINSGCVIIYTDRFSHTYIRSCTLLYIRNTGLWLEVTWRYTKWILMLQHTMQQAYKKSRGKDYLPESSYQQVLHIKYLQHVFHFSFCLILFSLMISYIWCWCYIKRLNISCNCLNISASLLFIFIPKCLHAVKFQFHTLK